ncbi:MAG TPA: branched-chain amino acid ABC transporter permease [Alphaproteobacteria bacterium]|jgi:branched-chain amino acid transport system permease protein
MAGADALTEAARKLAAGGELAFLRARHRFHWGEALPWVVALAAFFVFPGYHQLGTQILIAVLFTLSIDLILGYAGIVSLGHAAFYGTGAYIAGIIASKMGWHEPISGMLAGAAIAAVVGFLSGWVLLRTKALTLLMLTLSFTIVLQELANEEEQFTGGADGLRGITIDPVFGLFPFNLWHDTSYLYTLAVLFLVFLGVRALINSPFGQSLRGIRENERRMHAVGAPVHMRLVIVYTISAGIAGAAGALLAQTTQFVSLETLGLLLSGDVLIMIIIGGYGRLYGAFVGAPIYLILQDQLAKLSPTYWQFGLGLVLVLVVLYAPRGVLGIFEDIGRRFGKKP